MALILQVGQWGVALRIHCYDLAWMRYHLITLTVETPHHHMWICGPMRDK